MVLFSLFSLYFCTMHACHHCISLYFIPILKSPSRLHSLKTTSAHGIKLHPAFVLLNAIMHCLRARFFPSCAALRSCSLVCVCVCVCVCVPSCFHTPAGAWSKSFVQHVYMHTIVEKSPFFGPFARRVSCLSPTSMQLPAVPRTKTLQPRALPSSLFTTLPGKGTKGKSNGKKKSISNEGADYTKIISWVHAQ